MSRLVADLPGVTDVSKPDGIAFGIQGSAILVGQFLGASCLGSLSDYIGNRKIVLVGALLLSSFSYFFAALTPFVHYWAFVCARFLIGFAGGSRSIILAYIAEIVPTAQLPRWSIVIGIMASVMALVGPLLGSWAKKVFSATAPFYLNSGWKLTVVFDSYEAIETYSRIGLLRSYGTYSRIGLLRSYGNLQSYWTTAKLCKLTVVLDHYKAIQTYSRIGLLQSYGNLQSYCI